MSAAEVSRLFTQFKKAEEGAWLNEVSSPTLFQTIWKDFGSALIRWKAKKAKAPKFKSSRTAKPSFPICTAKTYILSSNLLVLPTIGKIRYQSQHDYPKGAYNLKPLNPRVVFRNEKWLLKFSIEVPEKHYELTGNVVGIDLGVKETAVTYDSSGNVQAFHNLNKSSRMKRKLKGIQRLQRRYSRSQKMSKNREKLRRLLRRKHERATNSRVHYNHKVSAEIVNLLPRRIVMESLNVEGMLKNRKLSKAIASQNFYRLTSFLRYKSEERGIEFVQVDRFYPSSKTCSNCGAIHSGLTLSDRTFVCPECGFSMDRDENAARNLMHFTVSLDRCSPGKPGEMSVEGQKQPESYLRKRVRGRDPKKQKVSRSVMAET